MRPIVLPLLLLLLSWAPALRADAPSRQVVVRVEGLACPFCVYGLERQLNRLEGVESAEVDLGGGKATLTLKPGAKVGAAEIKKAVRKAGFKASEVKGIEEAPVLKGMIEPSGKGFLLVAEDGTKYLLFDQAASDEAEGLSVPLRKRLEGLARKRAVVRGAPHEHKGMPRGLKVESVEPAQ